jgi:hypothetical protein
VFDLLGLRQNFVDRKLFGRLTDHLVLLGKIFWGEYIGSPPLFQQKAAAGNLGLGNRSCRHNYPDELITPRSHRGTERNLPVSP